MAPFINQEQVIFFDDVADSSSTTTDDDEQVLSSTFSLSSPTGTTQQQQQRSVSFPAGNVVTTTHYILHINDFTLSEQRDCWYNEGDMYEIRQAWKDLVLMMEQNPKLLINGENNDDDETGFCIRGLEGKTRDGKRIRRAARNSSITAVIDEQIYQDMDGIVDQVMIAMAYSECCFQNQKDAFVRGINDCKVAREIHELPVDSSCANNKENDLVGPTKFDFASVRKDYDVITRDGDELIGNKDGSRSSNGSIFDLAKNINNNNNKNNILGEKFRGRFACFLPITPKRYGRRVRNTIR